MITLEKCTNVFGYIDKSTQKRIKKYLENPTVEGWDDIANITIKDFGTTVWKAVREVDPTFPRTGKKYDGNKVIEEWEKIPDPLTVIRGIKKVTQ